MVVFLMSLWGLGVVKLSRRADGRYSLFGPEQPRIKRWHARVYGDRTDYIPRISGQLTE